MKRRTVMYKFRNGLAGLLGLLTLVVITTVTLPHIGRGALANTNNGPASQTQNVNVVNTPAVNALQSGTWNVGINGTPNINVANMPTVGIDSAANTVKLDMTNALPVRNSEEPARTAFQAKSLADFADGVNDTLADITTVPAGKRLVIQHVSIF